jgi:alpha-D-ribose 1-methylphosphonate 5-triphosphate diphosphatase PhnM
VSGESPAIGRANLREHAHAGLRAEEYGRARRPLASALRMVTANPARQIGLERARESGPGADADCVPRRQTRSFRRDDKGTGLALA